MDRLRAGLLHGLHHLVDDDIGLVRGRRADVNGLIRHFHMQRLRIRIGIDRHGGQTHLLGGLDHAAGDFAPVGNEDLVKHQQFL